LKRKRHRSRQQHRHPQHTGQGSEKAQEKHVELLAYVEQLRHYAEVKAITCEKDEE